MSTTAEKIAVMQAFERGEYIEMFFLDKWRPVGASDPRWDWANCEYRIARAPRTAKVVFVGSRPYEILGDTAGNPPGEIVEMVEVIK